jgi:thiamine monophosphate synthase
MMLQSIRKIFKILAIILPIMAIGGIHLPESGKGYIQ